MNKVILTRRNRSAFLGCETVDASIDWLANEEGQTMVNVHTDIGITCMLNISPNIQGSIFEFNRDGRSFTLSIDRIKIEQGEIVKMIFLAEGWW